MNREKYHSEEIYGRQRAAFLQKLELLHTALCNVADADEARTPSHYTHGAELAYVNGQLDEIIAFMTGVEVER